MKTAKNERCPLREPLCAVFMLVAKCEDANHSIHFHPSVCTSILRSSHCSCSLPPISSGLSIYFSMLLLFIYKRSRFAVECTKNLRLILLFFSQSLVWSDQLKSAHLQRHCSTLPTHSCYALQCMKFQHPDMCTPTATLKGICPKKSKIQSQS